MAADEDADALLAQALWAAEQADFLDLHELLDGGGAAGGQGASDDDSDFGGSRKPRRRQQGQRRAGSGRGRPAGRRRAAGPPASQEQQQQAPDGTQPAGASAGGGRDDAAAAATEALGSGEEQQQLSASGRRKRKDVGQQRAKGRPWTEQEEAAFLAGLEQHGRDWKAISAAIANANGSRDSRAVASHAQKHFIRLCLAGEPLPAAVAASGAGYTLSGKLLDPSSAAAAAYGFKPELLSRLEGEQLATALAGILPDGQAADAAQPARDQHQAAGQPAAKRAKRSHGGSSENGDTVQQAPDASPATAAEPQAPDDEQLLAAALAAVPPPPLAPSEAAALAATAAACDVAAGAAAAAAAGQDASCTATGDAPPAPCNAAAAAATAAAAAAAGGTTVYATQRPRRELAGQRQRLLTLGATSESQELLACSEFMGPVGSGAAAAQPYQLEVELQAMLPMEVHAHCSANEVIGLLGGSWDGAQRVMRVTTAYPCRRAAGSAAATSVELDAAAEVEARSAMAAAGQVAVGWYHSHPSFAPHPSCTDCENQRNYQVLAARGGADVPSAAAAAAGDGDEAAAAAAAAAVLPPGFVGLIVSPFDLALPSPASAITAFVVQQRGAQLMPYRMRYGLVSATCLPDGLAPQLRALLALLRHDAGRIDLTAAWRPFTARCTSSGGRLLGPPLSRLDKLLGALAWQCSHVADKPSVARWLAGLVDDVQAAWGVALPPHQRAASSAGGGGGGSASGGGECGSAAGESSALQETEHTAAGHS